MCNTQFHIFFSKQTSNIYIFSDNPGIFRLFFNLSPFTPARYCPKQPEGTIPLLGSLTGGPHQLVPFKREQIFKVDAFGTGEHVVAFGRVVSCDTMKPLAGQPTPSPQK